VVYSQIMVSKCQLLLIRRLLALQYKHLMLQQFSSTFVSWVQKQPQAVCPQPMHPQVKCLSSQCVLSGPNAPIAKCPLSQCAMCMFQDRSTSHARNATEDNHLFK